jgi:hypothetical protein
MSVSVAGKAVALLLCLSLFVTCGELDTLFPSNGSYQVRTLVNDRSLEECSIIRSNDKIRPYFAVSVVNDPDLIGLLVYLQDYQGEIVGEKVQYTLQAYAGESALTETEALEVMKEEEEGLEQPNNPFSGETAFGEDEIFAEEADENETDGQMAWELPEYGAVREKWSFTDVKPVETNIDVELEIAVRSLAQELPYFYLPKNLEIGPYILVFEAIGQREVLSRTETNIYYLGNAEFNLKDISMYLSGPSGSQLISPGATVMLEAGLDFDSRLDPYVIWYSGKSIINEGKISDGAGKLLWKAPEQAGFYSLRLEAFPSDIRRYYFTGFFREIALPVSPKAVSLGYFFENSQKHAARSPLSAGTAYPEQVQLIKAMLSSEESRTAKPGEKSPPVPPSPPELLQWYQFEGSLLNSMSAQANRQTLLPVNESPLRWATVGQSYGLSIGPDDPYVFSPVNFFRKEKDQGGGIFLLHIKPPTEGVILSVLFPLRSSSTDGAWMDMIKEKEFIALRLRAEGAAVEIPLYSAASGTDGLIPIVVEFYIRPYRLEAKISLDGYFQNKVGSIPLSGALSGEGRIILGGSLENSRLESSILENSLTALAASKPNLTEYQSEEIPFEVITETDGAEGINTPAAVEKFIPNTIWDELAVLFSTVPLLPEEPSAEDIIEQDAAENVIAATEAIEIKSENRAPAVQQEMNIKPMNISAEPESAATGSLISLKEGILAGSEKTGENEDLFPAADTDSGDLIKEREKQERQAQERTLTVLPENS